MAFTQYELSKAFWEYTFANPEKVKPPHIAIFFFAMEHCNRLGWKEKFGLPTSMTLEAIGMKSYKSYKNHFDDLASWGAFKVIEYSKNQYSSNIICLSIALASNVKALAKATSKHIPKQLPSTNESTYQSNASIDKPITNNLEPITTSTTSTETPKQEEINVYANLNEFKKSALNDSFFVRIIYQQGVSLDAIPKWIEAFNRRLIFTADTLKSEKDYRSHFSRWLVRVPDYRTFDPDQYSPMKDPDLPPPKDPVKSHRQEQFKTLAEKKKNGT